MDSRIGFALAVVVGATVMGGWIHLRDGAASQAAEAPANPIRRQTPADAQTEHPTIPAPIDASAAVLPSSQPKRAAGQPASLPSTPYQRALARLGNLPGGEGTIKQLKQSHDRIMGSPDEPTWTRPMEQELATFINSQPEIGTLEIASLQCRSAGCEIQVLAGPDDSALAGGWQAVMRRLSETDTYRSALRYGVYVTELDDRTVYLTTLDRQQPPRADAPQP
jgi:hypothetical protein